MAIPYRRGGRSMRENTVPGTGQINFDAHWIELKQQHSLLSWTPIEASKHI